MHLIQAEQISAQLMKLAKRKIAIQIYNRTAYSYFIYLFILKSGTPTKLKNNEIANITPIILAKKVLAHICRVKDE